MKLYDLMTGTKVTCEAKTEFLWLSDGSTIDLTKTSRDKLDTIKDQIYGYMISDTVAVSLKRSPVMLDYMRAKEYCSNQVNDGISGRLPSISELESLYNQLVSDTGGVMWAVLALSGVLDLCDYRYIGSRAKTKYGAYSKSEDYDIGWNDTWAYSGSKDDIARGHRWYLNSMGEVSVSYVPGSWADSACSRNCYAIPFFDIS